MKRIPPLLELAKDFYQNGDPAHDLAHIERVMKTAQALAGHEGADTAIVLAGALLHDIVNLPKDHPDRKHASRLAAEKSEELLRSAGFTDEEIARVKQVILEHSYSLGLKPSSLEAAIVQDADRIDALGAIGVMRAITVGGRLGRSFYDREDPLANARTPDDRIYSIDHFFVKLFKLPEQMNTASGKAEALARVEFMQVFLEQLKREVAGEFNP